jgi:hypothetical protein
LESTAATEPISRQAAFNTSAADFWAALTESIFWQATEACRSGSTRRGRARVLPRRSLSKASRIAAARRWTESSSSAADPITRVLCYLTRETEVPARIWRLDLHGGNELLWKAVEPASRVGLAVVKYIRVSPDAKNLALTSLKTTSDLFVADGIR